MLSLASRVSGENAFLLDSSSLEKPPLFEMGPISALTLSFPEMAVPIAVSSRLRAGIFFLLLHFCLSAAKFSLIDSF